MTRSPRTSRFSRSLLSATALSVLLGGCAPEQGRNKSFNENLALGEHQMMQSQAPKPAAAAGPVRFTNRVWLGSRSFIDEKGDPLPTTIATVTVRRREPLTLREIAALISTQTGIPVSIIANPPANASGGGGAGGAPVSVDATGMPTGLPAPPGMPPSLAALLGPGGQGISVSRGDERAIELNYTGSLRGLLDLIGPNFNVSWEYRSGSLRFMEFVTKTFALLSLPTASSLQAGLQTGADTSQSASGGGSSSGNASLTSNSKTEVTTTIKVWDEIEKSVKAMLPEGGRVTMSPATGTLTVTAPPQTMELVEEFIDRQNEMLAQQVSITVQVLSVNLNNADELGLDLDAVIADMGRIAGSVAGVSTDVSTGFGSIGARIIEGKAAKSSAFVRALSKRGKIAKTNTAAVTTVNNQAAPVQVVTQQNFIRSIQNTVVDGTVSTSVDPGVINTGFTLNLLPRVLPDGRIQMQYSLSLSDLQSLETKDFGSSIVQLPTVATRGFLQQVLINSGETLVLAGFEQQQTNLSAKGMEHADNMLFGGGRSSSDERTIIVLLISPIILDGSFPAASRPVPTQPVVPAVAPTVMNLSR